MADDGERRQVVVRRAPKLAPFVAIGIICGVVAALAVSLPFPDSEGLTRGQATGLLLVAFVPAGATLGSGVFLFLNWRSRRRAVRAEAEILRGSPRH